MAYYTYEEMDSGLKLLSEAYADRAELILLPNASVENRPIHAIAIGDTRGPKRPTLVLVGGVHAREWVPPDALLSLAADLLEAAKLGTGLRYGNQYFDKQAIARVMARLQIVILPCANPDGRIHSQTIDPDWRKNRARNGGDCFGVDINRNFDVAWDFRRCFAPGQVSASDDPCHKYLYVGPKPQSEPETRNIVWLLDRFCDARWFVDVHGAVPAVYHGWGIDENQTADKAQNFLNPAFDGKRGFAGEGVYGEFIEEPDLKEVKRLSRLMGDAIRAVNGDDYEVAAAFSLYATSGASDDYAYSRHRADPKKARVLSFTMECGHEFQPPLPTRDTVIREVSAALAGLAADASTAIVA